MNNKYRTHQSIWLYAMFYMTDAMVQSKGEGAKSQTGLSTLFRTHLINAPAAIPAFRL